MTKQPTTPNEEREDNSFVELAKFPFMAIQEQYDEFRRIGLMPSELELVCDGMTAYIKIKDSFIADFKRRCGIAEGDQ